jgi:hypothetical protein
MRRRRNPEIICGRVNANGTVMAGENFAVQKGPTGVFYLLFPPSFKLLSLTANSQGNYYITQTVVMSDGRGQVAFSTVAGAAVDMAFSFTAMGNQR